MPITVSVVIYVLNAAPTIARAIESVVAQSYTRLELIVVDGASTDGTTQIIERYRPYLARFLSEPDGGALEAANKGLALASGEILVFLMADDWLEPGALAEIAAAFAADPDCAVVTSGVRVVEERGAGGFATLVERRGSKNAPTLRNILDVPYAGASYYRRRVLLELGVFAREFPIAHDRELLLRLFVAGAKVRVIERPLYVYCRHAASRTLIYKPETFRRIYAEHVEMARRYTADARLDPAARAEIEDWAIEQRARQVLLELREFAPSAALRLAMMGRLYRPSAMSALYRRGRAILARRSVKASSPLTRQRRLPPE